MIGCSEDQVPFAGSGSGQLHAAQCCVRGAQTRRPEDADTP